MADSRLSEETSVLRRQFAAAAIERAALELFAAETFAAVPVARIATAAGVSVRSFYRYFGGKEAILLALPTRRADSIAIATVERPAGERPFAAMRAAIDQLSRPQDADLRHWQQVVTHGQVGGRMRQQVVAVTSPILAVALAERAHCPADDVWVEVAAATVATALVIGARRWAQRGGSLRDHILEAVDIVAAGLNREQLGGDDGPTGRAALPPAEGHAVKRS